MRSALRRYKLLVRAVLIGSVWSVLTATIIAQELVDNADEPQKVSRASEAELSAAPAKVDVNPLAHDDEIGQRLQAVPDATGWFIGPQVRVEEGVVFLNGRAETEELKKWAGDLGNTQDVVDVANQMEVLEPSVWDFVRRGVAARSGRQSWPVDGQSPRLFLAQRPRTQLVEELDAASTIAEGGLSSEAGVIGKQARQVQPLNDGENLLTGASSYDERAKKQNNSGKKAAG